MADTVYLLLHIMRIAGFINLCLLDDEFLAGTVAEALCWGMAKCQAPMPHRVVSTL